MKAKICIPSNNAWLQAITRLYAQGEISSEDYIKTMRRNYDTGQITIETYASILRMTSTQESK